MSQFAPGVPALPAPQTNTIGLVGFVFSLVGLLVTGGVLCPIGLILSLVGLGRQPRGFAIAGVILGLLGSCGLVLFGAAILAAVLAALGLAVVAIVLTEPEQLEITSDMANMAIAIKQYETENDVLPADLEVLDLKASTLMDPWGRRYAYHFRDEAPGFDIISRGADGTVDTEDDVMFTALGRAWATSGVGVHVEEHGDGGRVRISVGGHSVTAEGEAGGGRVTIDLGDRVIEITGGETGGEEEPPPAAPKGGGD